LKFSQTFEYKNKTFIIETDTSSDRLNEVICTGAYKAKAYCTADFLKEKIQLVYEEACRAIDAKEQGDINKQLEDMGFTKA